MVSERRLIITIIKVKRNKLIQKILTPVSNFFKGMVIGSANLIPGVSGGTMALVMGIYERLVEAIGKFMTNRQNRKQYILFLLPVLIGAVTSILLLSKVFIFLLNSDIYAQPTYFLFIGLILGSLPLLIRVHPDMKAKPLRILFLILGFGLVVSIAFIAGGNKDIDTFKISHTLFNIINISEISIKYAFWLFFCGIVSSASMVVPGLSGSAVLLGLGEYRNILYFISELMVLQLLFFGIGAIVGIVGSAKLIDYFLRKFPSNTYYFIIGLVIASIFQIAIQIINIANSAILPVILSILAVCTGFILAYSLSKINKQG